MALHNAGYRTAMMGKYLNGYLQGPTRSPVPDTYVPPGWSTWDVGGYDYSEYNYTLNQNGVLHHYGHAPSDYLTDVLARKGVQFVNSSAAGASAVLPRARDVRAARPVHAGAALQELLPGTAGAAAAQLRRAADERAGVAGQPPAAVPTGGSR